MFGVDAFEPFARTIENRFVFSLFDLLLCGVIVLVVLRQWRARPAPVSAQDALLLSLAMALLGVSFALGAAYAGALLFFEIRPPEALFDLLAHGFEAGAWVLLGTSALSRAPRRRRTWAVWPVALVLPLAVLVALALRGPWASAKSLDILNASLLVSVLLLFRRHPLGARHLATGAIAVLSLAALLHLITALHGAGSGAVQVWNLQQLAWSFGLLTFALAIGETSHDLFDRVFVRLHTAFILLAGSMMLVIIQSETTEYMAGLRGRSEPLGRFVRAHVEYFRQRKAALGTIVGNPDFLERIALGFSNLPELKTVRVLADGDAASFEIDGRGLIRQLAAPIPPGPPAPSATDDRFLIASLPLAGRSGAIELYGTRAFLDAPIRKRIVLIFSLFTGMVALSTIAIGLVVRGASLTMERQQREIEEGQRALGQASRLAAVGELAAGVAHEINNPATTILSRASFLLSDGDTGRSPSEMEDLAAIVSEAQRIAEITRGLLTFSRPQARHRALAPVERVVGLGLRPIDGLLDAHGISVDCRMAPDLPPVLADEASLARALENIFRNAIDVMATGGTLRIRGAEVDAQGHRLRLDISDSGPGMTEEVRARVFDPFFTTKAVGKGTGLGLAIVHGIVAEHGGTVSVESRLGEGATFSIVLPASPASA